MNFGAGVPVGAVQDVKLCMHNGTLRLVDVQGVLQWSGSATTGLTPGSPISPLRTRALTGRATNANGPGRGAAQWTNTQRRSGHRDTCAVAEAPFAIFSLSRQSTMRWQRACVVGRGRHIVRAPRSV